jgi:hypothetical protein
MSMASVVGPVVRLRVVERLAGLLRFFVSGMNTIVSKTANALKGEGDRDRE